MARSGSLPCCLWKKDGRQQPGCDQDGQHCWVPARNARGSGPAHLAGHPPAPSPNPKPLSPFTFSPAVPPAGDQLCPGQSHPPPCESAMGTAALVRSSAGDRQWDIGLKALCKRLVHMTIRRPTRSRTCGGAGHTRADGLVEGQKGVDILF